MTLGGGSATYVGHFVPWDGGCLFIGRDGGTVPVHAHYAIQIGFGVVPGIRFRTSEREDWVEYAGAVVASRQPHAMDATRVHPNAVIFVEPETREGRAIAERWLRGGIAEIPAALLDEVAPALFAAWQRERTASALARAVASVSISQAGTSAPFKSAKATPA